MNRLNKKCFNRNYIFRLSQISNCTSKNCYHFKNGYQFQAIPIFPFIQYIFRAGAMIGGRLINRWWRKLSVAERAIILEKVHKNSRIILGSVAVTTGSTALVYYRHLEYSEISGRRRFMAIGSEELNELLGDNYQEEILGNDPVSSREHPQYKFVKKIIETITSRNLSTYSALDREWKLLIVDNNSLINAACLPTGQVIVFTGLLHFVENQHQLAAVISHEMSHVLLEHGREAISRTSLLSMMLSVVGFVLWTFVPGDITAFFSNWLKNRVSKFFFELPYNRMLESEADILGLELMARACFKIEEAPRFWEIMAVFEKKNFTSIPEWLSTHPNSYLRAKLLEERMATAQKISEDCGCFKKSSFNTYINKGAHTLRIR